MAAVNSMHVELSVTIKASRERLFTALTKGVAVWWGAPYLEKEDAADLIFEAKLGGRLYEKWGTGFESNDDDGAILGTVVAIERPEYMRLQGPFGMREKVMASVLTIRLDEQGKESTLLRLQHDAIGTIDEQDQLRYERGWGDLLGRLEYYVEEGKRPGLRSKFHY